MQTPASLLALSLSLTAAVAGGYAPAEFPSYAALPAKAKPWFLHLAEGQEKSSEIPLLAKVPQAEPAIVELMQKITGDPAGSPGHLRLVIQAIQACRGLSAAHEAWLRELLLSRVSRTNGPVDKVLKTEGLLLLEYHPSAENEAVLVQCLADASTRPQAERIDEDTAFFALCALERTGTVRSLRALYQRAESLCPKSGDSADDAFIQTRKAIDGIENRVAPTNPVLQSLFNDCFPWCIPEPKAMARAEKALATRPELKPQLLAFLQAQYFEIRKWGGAGDTTALSALALRNDLTPAEQKIITTELENHVAPEDQSPFIGAAMHLLSHYPSPEHEALMLRFLNRDSKHHHILEMAFHTLSIIGGEKALADMREVQADMKAKNPGFLFLQELDRHIDNMQFWIERGTPPAKRQY
jgi:hypothetical protein